MPTTSRKRNSKWDWRSHLTGDELKQIAAGDMLLTAIKAMQENFDRNYATDRARIVNRGVQRAKVAGRVSHDR